MENILLLTNEVNRSSGWATVGYYLKEKLSKEYNVTVVSHIKDSNNDDYNLISTYNYYNIFKLFSDYNRIVKKLSDKNFDLIICNIEPFLPLAVKLKRYFKSKLILVGHGTYIYYPFVKIPFKYYNKFFVKYVDKIVVPSRYTYNKVREWFTRDDLTIIKWGVDTRRYYPKNVKKELAFIFVGAQKERKGTIYLLKAFEKILQEYPDVKLYMVGKKSQKYYRYIQRRRLDKNIVFHENASHEELLNYYSKSMVHILPSVNTNDAFEGFGLVHLEANACGIPSIGTLNTANEEIIIDGYNGFLVPQRNVDQLYNRLKLILEDKNMWKMMCKNSLKHAKEHTWEKTAKKFMGIIE
ncbi:MAG TPA: glycosyltransferase family 1 protein [Candidatus Nanopusillus sp.]|nr:glycosyltransferase family 1 protein [Candidatus Nanopusillus sp.]